MTYHRRMPRRLKRHTCPRLHVALFAIVVGLVVSFAAEAMADVQACLSASEKGQRARAAGKLREARAQFTTCGSDSCPALVRRDCSQWNAELESILPSVVFGAQDKQGRDLFDVTVSMDGEVIVTKLDGKSVAIDPGKHVFKFDVEGAPSITETALIKEGERARVMSVSFDKGGVAKPPVVKHEAPPPTQQPRQHTVYPWIVVGVGAAAAAVGAAIYLTSPDRPSNCEKTTQTCTLRPGESPADLQNDQETAGRADSQPILGIGVMGAGVAVALAGLVWHFLEPTRPAAQAGAFVRSATLSSWGRRPGLRLAWAF